MKANNGMVIGCGCMLLLLAGILHGSEVTGLVLVDADTDKDIGPIEDGKPLEIPDGKNINIRAVVKGNPASVRFALDGNNNVHTESTAPFAAGGDTDGDYKSWPLPPGEHRITATPYGRPGGKGAAGKALSVSFTVTVGKDGGAAGRDAAAAKAADSTATIPDALPGTAYVFREVKGVVVIEVESCPPAGDWKPEKNMKGFTGEAYYTWVGKDLFRKSGVGVLSYPVWIEHGGTYNLRIHNRHDFHDSTEHNDCWTRMDKGKWVKTFSSKRGEWTWRSNHEHGHNKKPPASYRLEPGMHLFQISGRSKGFSIDRVHLYHEKVKKKIAEDPRLPETRVTAAKLRGAGAKPVPAEATPLGEGGSGAATVSGELKTWHAVTIAFDGPATSEQADPNPFLNARLDVTFTRGDRTITVPGYYAADGNAGMTGAAKGGTWKAHFMPPAAGEWAWKASFLTGTNVAVVDRPTAGRPGAFHGKTGTFTVEKTDKTGRDLRGAGLLRYAGKRYLRFAESGAYFLKGGADSPENFLGYAGFDGTARAGKAGRGRKGEARTKDLHRYAPHVRDWRAGDPTWRDGNGKGIIGAVNYLSSQGMNSIYFIPYNIDGGDGKDVWPWTDHRERLRYDCSKLDQWDIVFSHMTKTGIAMHMITQEQENDQGLDGGRLGIRRRLYYRELIARFSHHPAVIWNLGEENTNTDAQRKDFCRYIRRLDPWDHPIVCHTFPGKYEKVYTPLLGFKHFEGPSLQIGNVRKTHAETLKWVAAAAKAGRPWCVCLDEIGPAHTGVKPDADDPDHRAVRHYGLWGNLMAGGSGAEWYFGYKFPHNDLNCEDWRSRKNMWRQTRIALAFFRDHLPFVEMTAADGLTAAGDDYCFARKGAVYAVYLPAGGTTTLKAAPGKYTVRWYNPREGGGLVAGSVETITGPGTRSLGMPPADPKQDWVVLVRK